MANTVRWHVIAASGDLSGDAPRKRTVHETYDGALMKVAEYNRSKRYSTVILVKGDDRRG